MAIFTDSAFYYGHEIDQGNLNVSFLEPWATDPTEKVAELNVGSYSLTEFGDELATRLSERGEQEYTVFIDRLTRKITIQADQTFSLLIGTGSTSAVSAYGLAGFSGDDLAGSLSYESNNGSGISFEPQFKLHNFVDFQDMQRKASASISESANGVPEIVSFGQILESEMEIIFSTNIDQGHEKLDNPIANNPTGYEDLRAFMVAITNKNTIEFIPDKLNPSIFNKALLQKTASSGQGVSFLLKEMRSSGLRGYWRSGKLTFREL